MKIEDIKTCPICSDTLNYELSCGKYHKYSCVKGQHFYISDLDSRSLTYFINGELAFVLNFISSFKEKDIFSLRKFKDGEWITVAEFEFPDLSMLYNHDKMKNLAEMLQFYG